MITCEPCNRQFNSLASLNQHLGSSSRHANCSRCVRGFQKDESYSQHLRSSKFHVQDIRTILAESAPNKTKATSANSAHSSKVDIAVVDTGNRAAASYEGIPGSIIKPIFAAACRRRFDNPSVEDIIKITQTSLEKEIVSAILEGALRLLPADWSFEGIITRKQKSAEQAARAQAAEALFFQRMEVLSARVVTEVEQKERISAALASGEDGIVRLTPDFLFSEPTIICGILCWWIEYKNTFGFRASPYIAGKHKIQLRKYASTFGPGIVVFKLGFECRYLQIDGVYCFREAEVIQWLESE